MADAINSEKQAEPSPVNIIPSAVLGPLHIAPSGVVEIVVGTGINKTLFVVSIFHLIFWSSYFKKMLAEHAMAPLKTLSISTYTASVFSLFHFWIHLRRIRWPFGVPKPSMTDLINLYAFAESTEVPRLQNHVICVMNMLPDKVKQLGMIDYNELWCKKLKQNGLLGKFVVDTIAMGMESIEHPENFPKEMLCELFKAARGEILRLETRERENGRIPMGRFTKFTDTQLQKYLIFGNDPMGALIGADGRAAI